MKITDAMRLRQVALEIVIKAVGTLRGWEIKTGGELLAEASIVEGWIKTGHVEKEKSKGGAAVPAAQKANGLSKKAGGRRR